MNDAINLRACTTAATRAFVQAGKQGPVRMTSAAFYRREAQRCRAAAIAAPDPDAAARWLRIAKDYDALGDALAAEEISVSPPSPVHQHAPD